MPELGRRPAHRSRGGSHEAVGRTTGALYAAGGLATGLAALADPSASRWLFALAAFALLAGGLALTVLVGRRLPPCGYHLLVGGGTALTSSAVLLAPTPTTALVVASLFSFVAADVFQRFRGAHAHALGQLVVLLAATCATLTARGVPPTDAAALCVVLTGTASVVGTLAARASRASDDPLTGLPNRRGFEHALELAVAESDRTGTPISAALVDVDAFKAVNDARGHDGGDALLRAIADQLRELLPAEALVGRLGGDEFAVALPHTDDDTAFGVLDAARRGLQHPLSVGVAERLPQEPTSEWLRRADAALYESKQLGRNRTTCADATSGILARDLAAALADPAGGGLHVDLQPVVEIPGGRLKGLESLVRWDHPQRGPLPPAVFVPVAEQTGQVAALGAFVRRTAFREVAALGRRLQADLVVSINASGYELVDPGCAASLLASLADAGLTPDQLVVEVTEGVVEGGTAQALSTLARLRDQGVAVAVDDFGAGYSTFSRLDEMPADFLKLDGALLDGATTSPRRRALLEAAIGVGDALGMPVIAEGVETAEQERLLLELGCHLAQGFLLGRPRAAADLVDLLVRDEAGHLSTRSPSPATEGYRAVAAPSSSSSSAASSSAASSSASSSSSAASSSAASSSASSSSSSASSAVAGLR